MGTELILQLTDMAHGGQAVGRHEGKVIFVPLGIPGELVRVEILRDKGRFAHAHVTELLSTSPQRVEPLCPYFGRCGGCQWQHLAYAAQLVHKHSIVQAQLERIAGLADAIVRPTLGMAEPWRYRNHVQFSVSDKGQLGFMAANSHQVIPIERCVVMHSLLEDLFEATDIDLPGLQRLSLRAGIHTGEQMIIFEIASDQPPALEVDLPVSCVLLLSDGTPVTLVGSPYIHEWIAERKYRLSAPSFFQVNTAQTEVLISLVSEYLSPGPDDIVIDAYCGVGTFALSLARKAKRVIGIESNRGAIADALANAAGMGSVSFLCGPAEDILPTLDIESPLVVVDPPRTGLDRQALLALTEASRPYGRSHAPARIVYVSCDPATLARDIKALLARGYALREVQPIDMFPQTYHIESVALLERT